MKSMDSFVCLCGILMFFTVATVLSLECYTCSNAYSNYMCVTDRNKEKCEAGYDTCQTMVSYSEVSEKMTISKSCSKNASCLHQINATKRTYPCGLDGTWICTTCCYSDLCNKDTASSTLLDLFLSAMCLLFGLHCALAAS